VHVFERYTEKARRTIYFARYESSQFGSPQIESEHLLLGILRENKTVTIRFLSPPSSWESIRKQIEQHTIIREKVSTSVDLPLSSECQRILAYAAEEADSLSHKFIGTEHLLLGILREQGCFAAKLLNDRDVSLETARNQLSSQPAEQLGMPPRSPGVPAGYTPRRLLYNAASEMLILELRRAGVAHLLPSRLFVRHRDSEVYDQIGNPAEGVCFESAVTCQTKPVVVFNSMKWEKPPGGGNWAGVYSFDLKSKVLRLRISPENLSLEEPHLRLWIPELISLSEDADTLHVNVGVKKPFLSAAVVHYFLARVNLSDGKLSLLAPLKDIRF
jgi:hypothetical protein